MIESKKYLLLLIIWISSNFAGLSQISDTVCFPVADAKKVLIAAEQGKEYQKQVSLLTERIKIKDDIILQMQSRDSLIKAGYENQMTYLRQELDLRKEQISSYERLIRAERRKRRFWQFVTGAVAAGAGYLILTK